MIKELLLAIALGAFLGFGITGGFFALNKNKTTTVASSELISPTPIQEQSNTTTNNTINATDSTLKNATSNSLITITSPENQSVVTNSKVTINGSVTPKSIVIISTTSKDYNTIANDNGEFSQDIELDSGANLINISSVDSQDNQAETKILITYSTAKI